MFESGAIKKKDDCETKCETPESIGVFKRHNDDADDEKTKNDEELAQTKRQFQDDNFTDKFE